MVSQLGLPEGGEWVVLLVIVVFLFGANKLPDLTRNAAKALNEFRKITDKDDEPKPELTATASEPTAPPAETVAHGEIVASGESVPQGDAVQSSKDDDQRA
jgi:sec-independent protein translocase protein TatA